MGRSHTSPHLTWQQPNNNQGDRDESARTHHEQVTVVNDTFHLKEQMNVRESKG